MLSHIRRVEDFPGFPDGIDGDELMEHMRAQSRKRGTTIFPQNVTSGRVGDGHGAIYMDFDREWSGIL